MKPHIKHYLSLADNRFQRHISFIFVMMNIIQRRTSFFQCRLAFRRSWFPKVSAALNRISDDALDGMLDKLKKNPHAKPDNDSEKAATELLRYVQYVSKEITGSSAEVNAMREEIWSIIRSGGLPHLYVTINPADFHNPLFQIFA
ncbi:hypothetical protein M422DRAFT_165945, partial [Sphaerobolus stellatus SS14]